MATDWYSLSDPDPVVLHVNIVSLGCYVHAQVCSNAVRVDEVCLRRCRRAICDLKMRASETTHADMNVP